MSATLPLEAIPHIDPTCTLSSIRKLTDAVAAGEIELSALVSFVKAAGNGIAPKFAVTSPVPLEMLEAIRANPDKPARQIVYAGLCAGAWTMEDVERFEANQAALSERRSPQKPSKGVYLTQKRRKGTYRPNTEGRYIPKMSLDVLATAGLCDGAKQCLGLIMSLAGTDDSVVTYTSALATTMRRTTRTVRNYFAALEEAGLIKRRPGKSYNTVHLTINPDCRPTPYKEPRDIQAFRLARGSKNPGLHLMAMTVVMASVGAHPDVFTTLDRRKQISVFNRESNDLRQSLEETLLTPTTKPDVNRLRDGRLSVPTSHSTLLLDPSKPINWDKPRQRTPHLARTTGFNHVSAQ